MTRRSVLALALIPLALGLAACANEAPGGPTAPSPGPTAPAPVSSAPSPSGALTEWPVAAPEPDTIKCVPLDESLSESLEVVEHVVSVDYVGVGAEGCSDKEVSSISLNGNVSLELSVERVDGPGLINLLGAIHQASLTELASVMPFSSFLTLSFPDGSMVKVNGSAIDITDALAEPMTAALGGEYAVRFEIWAGGGIENPVIAPLPPTRILQYVEVDGESVVTAADMGELIESGRSGLADVSSVPDHASYIEVRVPSAERGLFPSPISGSLAIPADMAESVDSLWSDAAIAWVEMVKGGNPHAFGFATGFGTILSHQAGALPDDVQTHLDAFLAALAAMGYEVTIETY